MTQTFCADDLCNVGHWYLGDVVAPLLIRFRDTWTLVILRFEATKVAPAIIRLRRLAHAQSPTVSEGCCSLRCMFEAASTHMHC